MIASYLTTNYEHSNFSISQTKFEEGLAADIAAILSKEIYPTTNGSAPPTKATSNMLSSYNRRGTIIGASIGATVFLVLILVSITCVMRRRKHRSSKSNTGRNIDSLNHLKLGEPPPRTAFSLQEIDHNSLIGLYRELPESGIMELPDGRSLSGPNADIQELSQPLTPGVHELLAYDDSSEKLVGQQQRIQNAIAISICTTILTESWISVGAERDSPRVETFISSGPRPQEQVDLNRSLPPTPISESPQISPSMAAFEYKLNKKHKNSLISREVVENIFPSQGYRRRTHSRAVRSLSEFGRCGCLYATSPLEGMEIVVPPGQSEARISNALKRPAQFLRAQGKFF